MRALGARALQRGGFESLHRHETKLYIMKKNLAPTGPRVPEFSDKLRRVLFGRTLRHSRYWLTLSKRGVEKLLDPSIVEDSDVFFKELRAGVEITVVFSETGKHIGKLSYDRMIKGEALMVQDTTGLIVYAHILDDDFDTNDADAWLQFVVCGGLKYS